MKIYTFGAEDAPVLLLLPGTCCHCAVANVHHGNHDFPAKTYGLAGVFKKGHNATLFLFTVHNAMLFTRCAHCTG